MFLTCQKITVVCFNTMLKLVTFSLPVITIIGGKHHRFCNF
uniref:Uncharacterized protein n=1 Tax=Anguilla anguilla TaxID=7936 RepID=A0A0E9QBK1_ANGAN